MGYPWSFTDMQAGEDNWRLIRQILKGKEAINEDQPE